MSRFSASKDFTPILDAAIYWRDTALLDVKSVFSNRPLWTDQNISALETHFVQNLDEGDGTFLKKLQGQLSQAEPAVKESNCVRIDAKAAGCPR